MEIVGTAASAVTLAALFKLCIQAFDVIHAAQHQALDLKKMTVKLNIEKCRLYTWGEAMGFTSVMRSEERLEALGLLAHSDLIQEIFGLILSMFEDSRKLRDKYGCLSVEEIDTIQPAAVVTGRQQISVLQQLSTSFNNFKIKSTVRTKRSLHVRKKTSWVVHDRKKFEFLILEAKSLVDGLLDITQDVFSRTAQQDAMSSRIQTIADARTLDWVSEICEVDYPAFSDAASLRADTVSDPSNFHRDIQHWKDAVALDASDDDDDSDVSSMGTAIANLEEMTITELKHQLSSYLLRTKDERLQAKSSEVERLNSGLSEASERRSFSANIRDSPLYPAEVRKRWGMIIDETQVNPEDSHHTEDESQINEEILSQMYEATLDQEFSAEFAVIEDYLRVLSPAERGYVFYKLGAMITEDPNQTRLFARIQTNRMNSAKHHTDFIEVSPSRATKFEPGMQGLPLTQMARSKEERPVTTATVPPPFESTTSITSACFSSYSNFLTSHKRMLSDSILVQKQTERAAQIQDLKDWGRNFHWKSESQSKIQLHPSRQTSYLKTCDPDHELLKEQSNLHTIKPARPSRRSNRDLKLIEPPPLFGSTRYRISLSPI